jgi:activating signal cointegrator 1
MKTLSLWQPHALAIGIGLKPWETRGWSTDYRGPIAIHAAKRPWSDVGPWHTEARAKLQEYVAKHGPVLWAFGAVVCTAELVSCIRTSELRGRIPAEDEFWGDFTDGEEGKGRFAFKLENVKMLAQPVYVRGMQGWFEVDLSPQRHGPVAGGPELGAEERVAAAGSMQLGLFDFGGQLSIPGFADPQQVLPAGSECEKDAATAPAADVCASLFDLGVAGAGVAQEPDEGLFACDLDERADGRPAVLCDAVYGPCAAELEVDQDAHANSVANLAAVSLAGCEESHRFAQACDAAGFQYRGYGIEGGDRVYAYSRPGAPASVFEMPLSRWDGTAESLRAGAARKCNPESGRGPMVSSSDDPMERRAAYLHTARWWRAEAQMNGKGRDSEEHWYAENQELLAADIERRPEHYKGKPANVTDWQWFQAQGVMG